MEDVEFIKTVTYFKSSIQLHHIEKLNIAARLRLFRRLLRKNDTNFKILFLDLADHKILDQIPDDKPELKKYFYNIRQEGQTMK